MSCGTCTFTKYGSHWLLTADNCTGQCDCTAGRNPRLVEIFDRVTDQDQLQLLEGMQVEHLCGIVTDSVRFSPQDWEQYRVKRVVHQADNAISQLTPDEAKVMGLGRSTLVFDGTKFVLNPKNQTKN